MFAVLSSDQLKPADGKTSTDTQIQSQKKKHPRCQ